MIYVILIWLACAALTYYIGFYKILDKDVGGCLGISVLGLSMLTGPAGTISTLLAWRLLK